MQQIKKLFYRNGKSYFSYVMIPVLFLVLMAAFQLDLINTYWQTIILLSGINGIVAMSLNLINGITGQSCLGQAGFMSIGAYVSAMCTKLVFDGFMTNGFSSYLFFIISLLIGGAAASLIGLLIGIPSLRLPEALAQPSTNVSDAPLKRHRICTDRRECKTANEAAWALSALHLFPRNPHSPLCSHQAANAFAVPPVGSEACGTLQKTRCASHARCRPGALVRTRTCGKPRTASACRHALARAA